MACTLNTISKSFCPLARETKPILSKSSNVSINSIARRNQFKCLSSKSNPATESKPTSPPETNGSATESSNSGGFSLFPAEGKSGSFSQVMAFGGPAPEIINGRLAMYGILWATINEVTQGKLIVDQLSSDPLGVTSTVFFFSLASFIPSILSEVPFGELMYSARPEGMPSQLKLFNVDVERINGRTAMSGFAVMLVIEAVLGAPTFNGALDSLKSQFGL